MRRPSTRSSRRGQLLFLLAVAWLALLPSVSRAAIPPAGQSITSRSIARYDRSGSLCLAYSNEITVSVLPLFGPIVEPNGTVSAPGAVERAFAGGTGATDAVVDVTTIVAGNLVLVKSVNPAGAQLPGTELTYRTDYSNVGTADLTAIVVFDAIPAWTQYRVGSATSGTLAAGITGITIEFSNDGGATWTYTPVSGGGGAPANFDAGVTNVRWTLAGTLAGGSGTVDGVGFIVRIVAE